MNQRKKIGLSSLKPQPQPQPTAVNSREPTVDSATHQRHSKVEVSILQQRVPRLPHEMDESADHQTSEPREIMALAAADISSERRDTDRAAQVNLTYKKLKSSK
jgi:hypothetical protein